MRFQDRTSPGDHFKIPRPSILFDEKEKLLIVATSWGTNKGASKAIETLSDYFLSSRGDSDATSPFRRLDYLSPLANNLRIAALVANERVYREENKAEYTTGVEIFAASILERELAWVQVGQPNVLLKRDSQPALPLSVSLSLANEVMTDNASLPPLPGQMLGIGLEPNLNVQSVAPKTGDALVLLNRNWIPSEIFEAKTKSFEDLTHVLASYSREPYWIGLWTL